MKSFIIYKINHDLNLSAYIQRKSYAYIESIGLNIIKTLDEKEEKGRLIHKIIGITH